MPCPVAALARSTRGARPRDGGRSSSSAWACSARVRSASEPLVAVGLVHDEGVGELEHALLHPLELVAGARLEQHDEEVDHRRDGDLGLADADRLDEHDVVARRLADEHRLARALRDAAEASRPTATGG